MTDEASSQTEPTTFFPQAFIANMRAGFLWLDNCLQELNDYGERARLENELCEGAPSRDNQRGASILYDNVMTTGREALVFLALCTKNLDFMKTVTEILHDDVRHATRRRLFPRYYGYEETLKKEIDAISSRMFDALEMLEPLMTQETWDYRFGTPFRGDPYMVECKRGQPLKRAHFNDWIEFNFFRFYRLPLGLYERGPELTGYMDMQIHTPVYYRQVTERLSKGRLHQYFPGLTLNTGTQEMLENLRFSNHVGPHVFFRPQRTAIVIAEPENHLPPQFGRLTICPK